MDNGNFSRQRDTCTFRPSVDRSRPHVLVSEYHDTAAVLTYRYVDTGERVAVPNTWLNKPLDLHRQEAVCKALAAEKRADALESCPPLGLDYEAVAGIIDYHRRKAASLRESVLGACSPTGCISTTSAQDEPALA